MGIEPSLEEIENTVGRLEQALAGSPLMALYQDLKQRFRSDLSNDRDFALSCGGALMLLKWDAERRLPEGIRSEARGHREAE